MEILARLRRNFVGSPVSAVTTLVLAYLVFRAAYAVLGWAVLHAVFTVPRNAAGVADTAICRAAAGACWAVIGEKARFILFGFYPYAMQWRPALAVALFVALYAASMVRNFWRRELAIAWIVVPALVLLLMRGGIGGLPYVPDDQWGGLPVTLILASFGLAAAFPLAVLTALGRRSRRLSAIRLLCVVYVELIRGVPLISLLFMASVMFPLFLPQGFDIDKLLRAQLAFILFAGAYLAEVVRAGLQAVPRGQSEAAAALGLSSVQTLWRIVLPQALRHVVPPLVNTFIGFFKDTSLVLIIGIFDLMTAGRTAIAEPAWQDFGTEVYVFLGAIYFAFCFALSRHSRRLETAEPA